MFPHNRTTDFLTIGLLLITLGLPGTGNAFRSTTQESFTDPDYLGYQPKVLMVIVLAENLEMRKVIGERLTKDFEKRGIRVYLHAELFPPTREWDDAQRRLIYETKLIEAVVAVGVGASSQEVWQVGSQTWGSSQTTGTANTTGSATSIFSGNTATTYGSSTTTGSSSTTSNSTTTAITKAKSNASFSAIMVDISENRTAWTSDIYTKAGGTLFVSSKGDAKAAAKSIIKGLIENNHIPKKAVR